MTEAGALLAHREPQGVAVAVEVNGEERLRRSRALSLHPDAALARVVDPAAFGHRTGQTLDARVHQSERRAQLIDHHGGDEAIGAVGPEWGGEGGAEIERAGVERHPDLGIGPEEIEGGHFRCGSDSTGDGDARRAGRFHDHPRRFKVGATEPSFSFHEGDEEPVDQIPQFGDPFQHSPSGRSAPAVDHHLAIQRIERDDGPLARELAEERWLRRRSDDDLPGPRVEPVPGSGEIPDPTAHPDSAAPAEGRDLRAVLSPPECGVQVHHGHLTRDPEALEPGEGIAGVERLVPASHQLDRAPSGDVDRWNDHSRISTPAAASACLVWATVRSPSWNIEAARTASAPAASAARM